MGIDVQTYAAAKNYTNKAVQDPSYKQDLTTIKTEISALQDITDNNIEDIAELGTRLTIQETTIKGVSDEVADVKGYIGYTDTDIVGVEVDVSNNIFTRLAGAVGLSAGADFDKFNAFGGRKRCNLTDDGVVTAYYGDDTFTTTGALETEVTVDGTTYPVGTAVQVMVEQPRFYYKVVPLKLEKSENGYLWRKARYYISDTHKDGFKLHPAFISNGVEYDKIYLSAFEGTIYDTSAETYLLEDEQIADFTADKLSSIANAKPVSGLLQNLTRANARNLAHNRGDGWEQAYIATISATQMLFLVEYAAFNIQTAIGMGAVSKTDDSKTNMAENTGGSLSLGDASGAVNNDNNIQIVSYRGEENCWGNIWKWVDGMNIKNPNPFTTGMFGNLYVADHSFADNTDAEPYEDTGIYPTYASWAYISAFGYSEKFDWLFIPTETKGNSSLPVGDCYQNINPDWRVATLGGPWADGSGAGAFSLRLAYSSSYRSRSIGGRVAYIPKGA